LHSVDHDAANGENAALLFTIATAPHRWPEALPSHQSDPHQQPIGECQDQQEPIKAICLRELRVPQRKSIPVAFVVSEQLLVQSKTIISRSRRRIFRAGFASGNA
jgi:hypothetical protein